MDESGKRNMFLKTLALGATGFVGAYAGADKLVFDGTLTDSILLAARDEQYRDKLISVITSGRGPEKIKQEYLEKVIPYVRERSLGEKVDIRESLLDRAFDQYEVRTLVEGDSSSNKYVLVADLKNNASVVKTESTDGGHENYTMTQFKEGPFISLPGASVSMGNPGELFLFSSYQTDRKVETYGENTKSICNGAVVLTDGSLRVIDRGEIENYVVGENCEAIQSYAIAVNSKTLNADLDSIEGADMMSAMGNPLQARKYECFITSFTTKSGEVITKAVSGFRHMDETTREVSGDPWHIAMSPEHVVGICNKIKEEGNYDSYVFVLPDPNYLHSKMNGPMVIDRPGSTYSFRTFSGNGEPTINETKLPIGFLPPYFLALKA